MKTNKIQNRVILRNLNSASFAILKADILQFRVNKILGTDLIKALRPCGVFTARNFKTVCFSSGENTSDICILEKSELNLKLSAQY